MQPHNGFWFCGTAVPGPPYTDYWTPSGAVLCHRANGSLVEWVRFALDGFELDEEGVAAWFGLELARLAYQLCRACERAASSC